MVRIAKEGWPIVVFALLAVAGVWLIAFLFYSSPLLITAGAVTLAGLGVIYFFRDPHREISCSDKDILLAPADGKVASITEVDKPEYIGGKVVRVSIVLSLFNVHINRMPTACTVVRKEHHPGRFGNAFREKSSTDNEHTLVWLDCDNGLRMVVKQIAGMVARRIVCNAQVGSRYRAGQRFGIIRFGSRTDLFLPVQCRLTVSEGDRVFAGTTPIGERP
jgi:phosphatidylserine decarboxylase